MYGQLRVVLSPKVVTTTGLKRVFVKGGKGSHPLGFWYAREGKFYCDLKSGEQWYKLVNSETVANKGLGGTPTQKALRQFVRAYYESEQSK